MIRRLSLLTLVAISLLGMAHPAAAAVGNAKAVLDQLTATAPVPFTLPAVQERTLSNGMRCFFLEDHLLPLFRLRIIYPGGRIYDPRDQVGLSGLLANLLRAGGTTTQPPADVDRALDAQAIDIAFSSGTEEGAAAVSSLSESRDAALRWLFELMYTPRFDEGRFELAKAKYAEAIRRQNDDPTHVGHRVFRKLLYGPQSPWAATPTVSQIQAVTIADLKALHATLFAPAQMLCAATGDFDTDALVRQLEDLMATYPERPAVPRAIPNVEPQLSPGVWIAPKATTQAAINFGHLSTHRENPDRFALFVLNEIFGSPATFTSWLAGRIRTQEGLAYETWSQIGFGPRGAPGTWQVHAKTRGDAAGRSLQLMRELARDLVAGTRLDEPALERTKQSILKQLVFQYETPFQVVSNMAQFVFLGYPTNYLEIYRDAIARVTLDDLRRVAATYLAPDQATILVVGDPKQLAPQLHDLGTLQTFDLSTEQ